ncbi:MAG: M48 family metallopeptidase [Burkholderiales bacterium]|nr:M48 family metallopeptidase [Burkholderiales bacterium]
MEHFNLIFMGLIFADLILKRYLNYRQTLAISNNYSKVPPPFDKNISLQEHQKAANYSLTKLRVASVELTFSILLVFAFTFGGGIEFIAQKTALISYPLSSEVLIIISYMLVSSILSLPFEWYKTFKVEQKFGFNKMTLGLFIGDQIKGMMVGLAIGIPLLYLVFWLMGSLGNTWWIWVWGVLVVFNLLLLVIYPTLIAPIFNKFTPLEDLELKAKIENLLTKCGFKSQGVFVMDGSKRSSHGNAYFTGLGNSKRIVFFDTLLKQLNHDEIIAVLAHELGHFKHKHIVKQMIVSFGITLIGLFIFSLLINQEWFYHSLRVETMNNATGLLLLFILTSTISLPLAPLSSLMSRKNEYEADNFAKENANKNDLISGLVSMYRDNASTLTPDSLYVKFYYSHPPAALRIANLEK